MTWLESYKLIPNSQRILDLEMAACCSDQKSGGELIAWIKAQDS